MAIPDGPGAIRDFFGTLDRHKASKGLFVTTSTFSVFASETAQFLSKRIVGQSGNTGSRLSSPWLHWRGRVVDRIGVKETNGCACDGASRAV